MGEGIGGRSVCLRVATACIEMGPFGGERRWKGEKSRRKRRRWHDIYCPRAPDDETIQQWVCESAGEKAERDVAGISLSLSYYGRWCTHL
jgi:hypothetical protein